MPTAQEIRDIVTTYIDMMCSDDIEGIMGLYAEDATAEDPVGGDVKEGINALREFYSFAAPALQVELTGPICVAGNNCAFPVQAKLTMGEDVSYLDATDVFTFNDTGKITSMRAYWSPEDMRPQP